VGYHVNYRWERQTQFHMGQQAVSCWVEILANHHGGNGIAVVLSGIYGAMLTATALSNACSN
jgi:hypothetical protein